MKKQFAMVAAAGLLAVSAGAHADPLTVTSGTPYESAGSFNVYSLDYLRQCRAAGDAACQTVVGNLPSSSSGGTMNPALKVMRGAGTTVNSVPNADHAFDSSVSGQTSTWTMAGREPSNTFAGDQVGTWEVRLGDLLTYLNGNSLAFMFGNNGSGSATYQGVFGTAQILMPGEPGKPWVAASQCYTLANGYAGDCLGAATPTQANYLPIPNAICVAKADGQPVWGATQAQCTAAGNYWTSNNLGQNATEFMGYSADLNRDFAKYAVSNPNYVLSIDIRLMGIPDIGGGGEDIWICADCRVPAAVNPPTEVPEPGTLALVGLALAGGAFARRARARR